MRSRMQTINALIGIGSAVGVRRLIWPLILATGCWSCFGGDPCAFTESTNQCAPFVEELYAAPGVETGVVAFSTDAPNDTIASGDYDTEATGCQENECAVAADWEVLIHEVVNDYQSIDDVEEHLGPVVTDSSSWDGAGDGDVYKREVAPGRYVVCGKFESRDAVLCRPLTLEPDTAFYANLAQGASFQLVIRNSDGDRQTLPLWAVDAATGSAEFVCQPTCE